jgi:hypothetical protein
MKNNSLIFFCHKPFIYIIIFAFFYVPIKLYAGEYKNEATFSQIYTKTINGDIAATGASIMCAKKNNDKCDWNYKGYLFDITPKTLNDGGSNLFSQNSSGAILKLPVGVNGSDILWARLYWQGHIFGLGNHNAFLNAISGFETVKMVDPKGNMHNLIANSSDIYYYGYDEHYTDTYQIGYRIFYQASIDVTSIVQQSYDATHNYFLVGNINATEIKDTNFIYDTKLKNFVKWGNWGGWSLIVVYKDPNTSLKNISLYDGFKFLLPPFGGTASLTIDLPPNSFYTPDYGAVKSKTIMFAAGAEKKIAADKLEMKNKNKGFLTVFNTLNPANNQINDSITYLDQEINATRIFNAGIDLDTYDTSNILANSQTTTSLKVTMTASTNAADQAFVGFIGISNDIYQPKICYVEQLYDNNSTEINSSSHINVGDTINVKLTIRNDDNATAENVSIIRNFDDNKTTYEENSTIANNIDTNGNLQGDINQTDIYGDDLTDYNISTKSLTVRLGRGANNNMGGVFLPGDSVQLKYKTTINTNQSLSLSYNTSYVFSIAGQQFIFDGPLPKCTNFDNTIQAYLPPIGVFNVVNANVNLSGGDTTDRNDPKNSLYTQVVNHSFNVKVVHLNSVDKTSLENFNGIAFLELVDASSLTTNPSTCANAPLLFTPPSSTIPNFNNESTKNVNISIPIAARNATFRIGYTDWSTRINNAGVTCTNTSTTSGNLKGVPACLDSETKIKQVFPNKNITECLTSGPYGANAACNPSNYNANGSKGNIQPAKYNNQYGCAQCLVGNYICARDNFAIKPATYSIDINDTNTNHIGGKYYPLDINATDGIDNVNVTGYDQTINKNSGTIQLIIPVGCTDLNATQKHFGTDISFSAGKINQPALFHYDNIGDINITIVDNNWTQVDQSAYNGKNFDDCIVNSTSNTPVSGKVGCNIEGNKTLKFIPKAFRISLNMTNFNSNPFTYISNDGNMSAQMDWIFTAILDDNTTSTISDNPIAINYTKNCYAKDINYTIRLINDQNLSWSSTKNRIKFFQDNNSSISSLKNLGVGYADFNSSQLNFNQGIGRVKTYFNFDRNLSKTDEPFKIFKNDFNLTSITDADGVSGSDFNRNTNQNTTFYYARVHSPDYRVNGNTVNVKIYYEVYCRDCNQTNFNSLGSESIDSIYWYINKNDNNISNGHIYNFINSVKINPITPSTTKTNGEESDTVTYNGSTFPYRERIDINASSWLIYNPYNSTATTNNFNVEFLGSGSWAGIGNTGKTVDLNISVKGSKRIDW